MTKEKKLKENYQEPNSKSNVLNSALITKYLIMLMVICLFRAWLKSGSCVAPINDQREHCVHLGAQKPGHQVKNRETTRKNIN